MKEQVTLDGSTSNNEAEYDILINGLKICLAQKIRRLMVKGDALLIVKQILGIWVCKNERLKTKVTSIRKLFSQFEEVQLYHIPRKENEDADLLAQQAISNQDKEHVVIAAIALKDPQYAGMESLTPMVNYILEGEFPKEFTTGQRRKLIKQASTFLWLEGSLYQKGKDLVCRRVPSTNEISKILKGLHEEACGGHFSHELTLKKVLLAGYVWPSMHADVQHWCRSCHNCQVNGNKRLLYGPRQAVIANGPFEKWGIDAMGPLPRTANGKHYILVAINYMTRFGTPLEIVSDNGPGFRRGILTESLHRVKLRKMVRQGLRELEIDANSTEGEVPEAKLDLSNPNTEAWLKQIRLWNFAIQPWDAWSTTKDQDIVVQAIDAQEGTIAGRNVTISMVS
ncbi:hypothetical protein L7F22_003778 [Adiantum nelumboides]|nr:hypothetical protein [Adiantum nelumboides]